MHFSYCRPVTMMIAVVVVVVVAVARTLHLGFPILLDSYGLLWIPMDSYGLLWIPMDFSSEKHDRNWSRWEHCFTTCTTTMKSTKMSAPMISCRHRSVTSSWQAPRVSHSALLARDKVSKTSVALSFFICSGSLVKIRWHPCVWYLIGYICVFLKSRV